MIVDLFIPCFIDQFFPETAFNTIKVLEKVGCGVNYNPEQTCCGQPAFNSGRIDDCRAVAEKFVRDMNGDRYLVSPSSSCVGMVRNYYPELFGNSALHNPVKNLRKNSYEISDFLVNVMGISNFSVSFPHKITFHDSCAALRELNLKKEARVLLSNVKGLELIELQDAESCCGFGGTFAIKNPEISVAMAESKLKNAANTGAEYFVSTDWSCLMHLKSLKSNIERDIKFIHLVDLIAMGIE